MFDRYNRHIHYLRISVTDRCNLRCRYCMPSEGIQLLRRKDIMTFEEITALVKVAVDLGIDKIRITGGEPLVRHDIVDLIALIASVKGIRDLALTTNGILLKQYAGSLKVAGLHRVNVSLDTMDPARFASITRGGDLRKVIEGIMAAKAAGLSPVKINCVVSGFSPDEDAETIRQFGREEGLQVRFIRQMNLETGEFSVVEGGEGGYCASCNRLRLTANGFIKPCLFSEQEYSVRELGAQQAIMLALNSKPLKGCHNRTGSFYNIGG